MKAVALNLGSMLGCIFAAHVAAAEPLSSPPAPRNSSANGRLEASSDVSAYARRRERLRQAGWLRQETTRRLRAEAGSEGDENLRAVEDLIDLYVMLRLDKTLTDSGRDLLAGRVRSRLLRIHQQLEEDPAEATAAPATISTASPTAAQTDSASEPRPERPARGQLADFMARRTALAAGEISRHVLSQQGLGGPAGAVAAGAAAAPPFPPDYGPELADLIQTVIAPSTWERNGGPGSIYYYRPRQVLVIRQTGQVHEDIGDVVEQLRQAGN